MIDKHKVRRYMNAQWEYDEMEKSMEGAPDFVFLHLQQMGEELTSAEVEYMHKLQQGQRQRHD